ncbi:uncharacterized protein LOC115760151 [Drosophila novamexicana]|uniref:uncharacterized protein LOC115760151 n=1 Tax=Drosophila novamexicana TaxID=47314 RepID=UPI0011E59E1F|nr:uncharacterized protein LOC115760151 [Drosophila novamexicana]
MRGKIYSFSLFTPVLSLLCITAPASVLNLLLVLTPLKMFRHCNLYMLGLLLVASACLISNVDGYRQGYRRASTSTPTTTTPPPQTPKEYLDSKSSFSTFGIIAIIFTCIVISLAFYYGIMCYPLLCREDKKYRFMDVSTITAATSRSIQSIENYPVDQKHNHQLA